MSFLPAGRFQKLQCEEGGVSDASSRWVGGRSIAHNFAQSTSADPKWLSIASRAMAGIAPYAALSTLDHTVSEKPSSGIQSTTDAAPGPAPAMRVSKYPQQRRFVAALTPMIKHVPPSVVATILPKRVGGHRELLAERLSRPYRHAADLVPGKRAAAHHVSERRTLNDAGAMFAQLVPVQAGHISEPYRHVARGTQKTTARKTDVVSFELVEGILDILAAETRHSDGRTDDLVGMHSNSERAVDHTERFQDPGLDEAGVALSADLGDQVPRQAEEGVVVLIGLERGLCRAHSVQDLDDVRQNWRASKLGFEMSKRMRERSPYQPRTPFTLHCLARLTRGCQTCAIRYPQASTLDWLGHPVGRDPAASRRGGRSISACPPRRG